MNDYIGENPVDFGNILSGDKAFKLHKPYVMDEWNLWINDNGKNGNIHRNSFKIIYRNQSGNQPDGDQPEIQEVRFLRYVYSGNALDGKYTRRFTISDDRIIPEEGNCCERLQAANG